MVVLPSWSPSSLVLTAPLDEPDDALEDEESDEERDALEFEGSRDVALDSLTWLAVPAAMEMSWAFESSSESLPSSESICFRLHLSSRFL